VQKGDGTWLEKSDGDGVGPRFRRRTKAGGEGGTMGWRHWEGRTRGEGRAEERWAADGWRRADANEVDLGFEDRMMQVGMDIGDDLRRPRVGHGDQIVAVVFWERMVV